ncbi:triacylglycerol lipase [Nocardioides sp. R-C-SC26]|uniref:esterase/lipase family protein n=1 Tax=Nocardioides sp. R-C-SC26 TaxID=2870414 RepID=UPI001E4AA7E1|nr:alpha/beta fold hydrolase [Nocardioides sp. R-C-SC26]
MLRLSRIAAAAPTSRVIALGTGLVALAALSTGAPAVADTSRTSSAVVSPAASSSPTAASAERRASGPRLTAKPGALRRSLTCTGDLRKARKQTVLLVHGTGAVPEENFSWNFDTALKRRGYPSCRVTIPGRGLADVQVNVEFVVHAIREAARRSGRPIAVIGHSQGAFLPTYALRIWPDLAAQVDDFIGYAGVFTAGTSMADLLCGIPCAEAFRQFSPSSNLLAAVRARPLPTGPSYTSFATRLDEIVTPQPTASRLKAPGAVNVVLQDHCPTDIAEHLTIIAERPFFQLTFDALSHPGPARLKRVGALRCGFDRQVIEAAPALPTFGVGLLSDYLAHVGTTEPPLRSYWRR